MDHTRNYRCFKISVFSFLALACALPARSESTWSSPEVSVRSLGSGVTQRIETSHRNFKETPTTRNLETRVAAEIKEARTSGQYTLVKKQIYHGTKLLTFYRKLDAKISGDETMRMAEQTQISKEGPDFSGTLVREFYPGNEAKRPAARVMIHFEHGLLATAYTVKLFTRSPGGVWQQTQRVIAPSIAEALNQIAVKIASAKSSEANTLASFVVAVWQGSLSQGVLDLTQFLYPMLSSGTGDLEQMDLSFMLSRSQLTLKQSGVRGNELEFWQQTAAKLAAARQSIEATPSITAALRERYTRDAQALLNPPEKPLPSQLQSLHESLNWLATHYDSFAALAVRPQEYSKQLASLPAQWAMARANSRAEVYLRALYVMLISREASDLDRLAAKSTPPAAAALRDLRISLMTAIQTWRAVASTHPQTWREIVASIVEDPWAAATPAAWAADFTTLALGQSDVLAAPPAFTMAATNSVLPKTAAELERTLKDPASAANLTAMSAPGLSSDHSVITCVACGSHSTLSSGMGVSQGLGAGSTPAGGAGGGATNSLTTQPPASLLIGNPEP